MSDTIFDKIVNGKIDSYKIWEDENYLAFLTPFPNTPGATVVIPKINLGDNVYKLDEESYLGLMKAVKTVVKLLEKTLKVSRVAVIVEGTGIAYAHVKLYPLHGELASKTDIWIDKTIFNEEYQGYLSTLEGPTMDSERLKSIQNQILSK